MKLAIIGTRNLPTEKAERIERIVVKNRARISEIITGGADGADTVAIEMADKYNIPCTVYIPWYSYNHHLRNKYPKATFSVLHSTDDTLRSVHKYHPAPHRLSDGAFKLMERNYLIIKDADIVLCAFRTDTVEGGTAQGYRIAKDLKKKIKKI